MKLRMLKIRPFVAFSLAVLLSVGFVFATEKDLFFSVEPGTRRVKIETLDDSTGEWSTSHAAPSVVGPLRLNCSCLKMSYKTSESLPSDSDPFRFHLLQRSQSTWFRWQEDLETKHDWPKFDDGIGRSGLEAVSMDTTATTPEASEDTQEDNDAATNPQAVESDIWKIEGNTLYFFNQNRGLQIYDLTTPWKPERLAYLRMPALGEQMYVLDDQRVVLLLRRPRELEAVVPETRPLYPIPKLLLLIGLKELQRCFLGHLCLASIWKAVWWIVGCMRSAIVGDILSVVVGDF